MGTLVDTALGCLAVSLVRNTQLYLEIISNNSCNLHEHWLHQHAFKRVHRIIITQVLSHYVTHLLCLDGVNLCLFSVNFCQSILILDVDYVLFTKRNALEISSCGGDQFSGKKTKTKQNHNNPKLYLGNTLPGQIETTI